MSTTNSLRGAIIAFGIFLLSTYSIIFFLNSGGGISLHDVKVLGWFALLQFLYSIYTWYKIKHTWFDAYIVFIIVLYAFMLSQPILEAMGAWVEHRRLWQDFGISSTSYYWAMYYSMIASLFFHFGAIASLKKQSNIDNSVAKVNKTAINKLQKVALCVAVISAPFYIYILVQQFIIVQVAGYAGLYNWEEYASRSAQILSDAFVPSILILFCISMITKQYIKLTLAFVVLLVFLPPFFLGGRSNAMISFAIFFVVYMSVNKIKTKHLILLGTAGILMLTAMNIVGKIRGGNERSLDAYKSASEDDSENALLSTLGEMGWSMYPTALSISVIPDKIDYAYGSSFFWAGVSIIPNLGFWDGIHPGKINDPGYKLDQYANLGYGMGYSIIAGTYNEFGYLGFVIMFIYGYLFCWIFSYISPQMIYCKPVQYILAILFLWFSIKFVRNSFDSIVRSLVYYVLPYYFIVKLHFKKKI